MLPHCSACSTSRTPLSTWKLQNILVVCIQMNARAQYTHPVPHPIDLPVLHFLIKWRMPLGSAESTHITCRRGFSSSLAYPSGPSHHHLHWKIYILHSDHHLSSNKLRWLGSHRTYTSTSLTDLERRVANLLPVFTKGTRHKSSNKSLPSLPSLYLLSSQPTCSIRCSETLAQGSSRARTSLPQSLRQRAPPFFDQTSSILNSSLDQT